MTARLSVLMLGVVFLPPLAAAGEYNKALNVGDDAPAWTNLPGVDGKMHALADLKDKLVVVLVFTCNSCPVARDYEDRIIEFAKKHSDKVALIAVNVNRIEDDRLPKMKERAKEKGFEFPYIFDESQKIAKLYGATYTPEFFVLDKDRKVAYMGAMDDRSPPAKPKEAFLERAVEAVLKGQKPAAGETLARGCKVRYARPR
jgi:peroxiredoxin